MQAMVDKFKDNPQIDEFIKEAVNLNSLLLQQEETFYQKISQINPYYETSDKLTIHVIDIRFEYEKIHKNVLEFITWKESEDGRKVDLPTVEETHKDIVGIMIQV